MSTEETELHEDLSPIEYQRLRDKGVIKFAADPSAEGEKQPPKTEVPTEAPEAPEEPETAPASDPGEPEEEEEKAKGKGGFQRRIDKLTSKLRLTEQERDELRELVAKKPAAEETKVPAQTDRPLRESFVTEDEWIDAYADWRDAKKEAEARQAGEKQRLKVVFDNFNKQVTAIRETHDDFDEVLSSAVEIPKSVELAIPHLENGAAVAYHLGKNPDIALKLMDMDPLQAVAEIGKISEKLLSASSNGTRPPDKKLTSKAPAPITPVDTGSSRSSVALEDLSPSEYIRKRNADEAKKRAAG